MPRRKQATDTPVVRRPPATTPEGIEAQLVALATDLVEKRLRAGTATSAEVVTILKMGSETEKLQRAKLGLEAELLKVKRENYEAQTQSAEIYEQALKAFRSYQGVDEDEGL